MQSFNINKNIRVKVRESGIKILAQTEYGRMIIGRLKNGVWEAPVTLYLTSLDNILLLGLIYLLKQLYL